jgi:hypothetical protein
MKQDLKDQKWEFILCLGVLEKDENPHDKKKSHFVPKNLAKEKKISSLSPRPAHHKNATCSSSG